MPARIGNFVRNASPNPYCDACLSTALGLDRSVVAREMRTLEHDSGFVQSREVCTLCGSVERVISFRG